MEQVVITPAQRTVAAIKSRAPPQLDESLKALYSEVAKQIHQIVGSGQFSVDQIKALVPLLITAVQGFSDALANPMTGPEKQALALDLARAVLGELKASGHIDEGTYNDVMVALVTVGPALIDFAVDAWKQGVKIAADIQQNGCAGCSQRNGCNIL